MTPAGARRARLVCAAVLAWAPAAHAYELKTTSAGARVHWAVGEVVMTPAFLAAPEGVPVDAAEGVLGAAVATWQAELAETPVALAVGPADPVPLIHGTDGVNQVRWAFAGEDPDVEDGVLALTFVAYRPSDGVIEDADIVVNAASFRWVTSTDGCAERYDLESALTHELGHLLGLAHAIGQTDATMFATGQPCETLKRDLALDDQRGIEALYGGDVPGAIPPAGGGCASSSPGGGVVLLALLPVGALLARRRRPRFPALGALVIATLLVLPAGVDAAQLRRLELSELAHRAALVVRGRVRAVVPAADGSLSTDATIVIDDCLAGRCPREIVVRRRGGEQGDRGLWVDGEADLRAGAEVVLYLRIDAAGRTRVLGGVQGVLRVIRGAGPALAIRDLRGHEVQVAGGLRPGGVDAIPLTALPAGRAP